MTEITTMTTIDDALLGETSGQLHLNNIAACRDAALRLASQAKRSIYIFTYDLDSNIYDQTDFLEAVKDLAIRSEYSRVKILLQNNEKVQRQGHRLIQLWRRLTSKIEIRRPCQDHIDHPENFLLVDETGYLHRRLYSNYDAIVDFNSKFDTKMLNNFFHEAWEQSEPDTDLRVLHI